MGINDSTDLPLSPATAHLWAIEQAAATRQPPPRRRHTRVRRLLAVLRILAGPGS